MSLEEEEKELQFFKKMVKEYMKLTDEIKKLERACKVRKEKKENKTEERTSPMPVDLLILEIQSSVHPSIGL